MEDTKNLNISKLGTKQYWDEFYSLERNNFSKNSNDTGECWFNDNDAEERMIEFLEDNLGMYLISKKSSMLDLGTGNGHLLFELIENGFDEGKLLGIDYSEESVKFAKEISNSKEYSKELIDFKQADIFQENWLPDKFDIVLDKGTLDAIALSGIKVGPNKDQNVVNIYNKVIEKLLPKDGVFLITSCNFTEDELIEIIEKNSTLKCWETVPYPVFEFGGVKGTTICTVAFVKQ
ncbi:hypothetical protein TBLA_0C04720 [Henningerozyma blattae CBS 6284]|uniref:Protein-lysine N-methyltransferase EFM4 n=1 Tax=Henningerozyma blattae (strain ATCC 34711 / CBS 6284 / DSM 70876 / NBRC 10599 / NRRL Y-10934 / UCD 77-7) TaxID=1071380 RepID=I2H1L6_HENB6|nr:hypothetical protein TBLA_0C04720 [Tetrapisispora blattae CBS 6284]CCH60268.1 hypothetical protein TBLA_0C04720 [Tetrapisispora blattae CBS 6284]